MTALLVFDWWEEPEDEGDFALLGAHSAYGTEGYPNQDGLRQMPYGDYLRSGHWQVVRQRALLRAGSHCQLCEASDGPLNVHHLSYNRRGHEREEDVMVLCYPCHRWVHANPDRAVVLRWVNVPHAKLILQSDAATADWARHLEPTS